MKQIALAVALIAAPVAAFSAYQSLGPSAVAAAAQPLGDLTEFQKITTDIRTIADSGDLIAAERRATDLETLWDDEESNLRPKAPEAWGNVDQAADGVFKALRRGVPTVEKVDLALNDLQAALSGSATPGTATGTLAKIDGIAVTDSVGHPLPCEDMVGQLKSIVEAKTLQPKQQTEAEGYLTKALERCNADDDAWADAFSAHGISLASK